MKSARAIPAVVLLFPLLLLLGACTATVTVEVSQAEVAKAVADGLADSKLSALQVDLQDGYIDVRAEKQHPDGSGTDSLAFRLDLGVSDGHLTATISQAQLNGQPVEADKVAAWNERIAERLERAARRRPNSALQSVAITNDKLTMSWQVTVPRGTQD
jgi:hypothetical protein